MLTYSDPHRALSAADIETATGTNNAIDYILSPAVHKLFEFVDPSISPYNGFLSVPHVHTCATVFYAALVAPFLIKYCGPKPSRSNGSVIYPTRCNQAPKVTWFTEHNIWMVWECVT